MRNIWSPLTIIAILVIVAGIIFAVVSGSSSSDGIEITPAPPTPVPIVELKVYISGAVAQPGVYTMGDGDRVSDVIISAGGVTEDADITVVNLARRVKDEDHLHIPVEGETFVVPATNTSAQSGTIDINTAAEELLKTLPGIGEVKAQAIIRYRETNGPFATIEDLLDVSGIGPATFDAITELVEVR